MERRAHFTVQPSGSKNQVCCSWPYDLSASDWYEAACLRWKRFPQASKEARRRLEELLEVEHEETQLVLTNQLYDEIPASSRSALPTDRTVRLAQLPGCAVQHAAYRHPSLDGCTVFVRSSCAALRHAPLSSA
jgi:hypothetical protein